MGSRFADSKAPNLDRMSREELAEFAEAMSALAEVEQPPASQHLSLAARYAKLRVRLLDAQKAGKADLVKKCEEQLRATRALFPKHMKW
jgi:hypothetical protein